MATRLAEIYDSFLADAAHLDHLRPHTLRAYRYELALAAADPRFAGDLAALSPGFAPLDDTAQVEMDPSLML